MPLLRRHRYDWQGSQEDQDDGTAEAEILQELQAEVHTDEPGVGSVRGWSVSRTDRAGSS